MKDKELRQILRSVDETCAADVEIPDMSAKIKNIAAELPAARQNEIMTISAAAQKTAASGGNRKKLRTRIVAASLACIFLIGSVTGILIWVFGVRLNYDFKRGLAASARAREAQYLPNVEKLVSSGGASAQSLSFLPAAAVLQSGSSTEMSAAALGMEDFLRINEALAAIDGSGLNMPAEKYDIYEIRAEVEFIFKIAPIFNKWFKLPYMEAKHGFIENFPYEDWAYYLQTDKKANEITVTRVCSKPFMYRELGNEAYEFKVMQWQLMQTKIYFDEQGREVVECYVFKLITDLKDRDGSWDAPGITELVNYIPVSIEYLKNVKDTSLTKYYIRFAENYYSSTEYYYSGFQYNGTDLRGLSPYGSSFDFIRLDYADGNDITMLRLTGELPVSDIRNKPQATAVSFYNKSGADVRFYASVHDYYDAENSNVEGGYPMPGGRDAGSEIDIIKLFIDDGPLVTDYCKRNYGLGMDFGKTYYEGLISSAGITRHIQHYSAGAASEQELMQNVYGAINGLADNIGASGAITSYNGIDGLLGGIRQTAVESFGMSEWLEKGKRSVKAAAANNARGDFYGKDMPICELFTTSLSWKAGDKTFGVWGHAKVLSEDILSNIENYSLGAALVSETGKHILLATDYNSDNNGNKFFGGYYIHFNADINLIDLEIKEKGTYTLKYVITQKVNGADVIIFDTKAKINIFSYDVFLSLDKPSGYRITCEARTLRVIVP